MKEQAWGDIFIHFKKKKKKKRAKERRGGVCRKKARKVQGRFWAEKGEVAVLTCLRPERTGWRGMSAPQVLPVADDSLLSSSGTS